MHPAPVSRKAARLQSNSGPIVALVIANVTLAFGPWFVRLTDVGPVAAGFWRITLAAPILLGAAMALGQRPLVLARGLWGMIAVGGVAFAADLASWHVGIHRTNLANATLFGNAAIFIFPLYGFLVARTWPTRMQGVALLLAAVGGGLLMGRSAELSSAHLVGDLLCLLAGLLYAVYFIVMARVREAVPPLPALALSTIASIVPLLVGALALGERVLPNDWTPLLGLALVSQVIGQGCMIFALGRLTPLVVGLALLIQPVVAGTVGWIVYGERLGLPDLAGAICVGIALVLVRERRASTEPLAEGGGDPQKVTA